MAPQSGDAIEVFYSYSHKDEPLRDQLENHLVMLQRDGVVKGWHDRRIIAGQEWDRQIDAYLNSADIILLLVSSDFLASKYCYDIEVKRAMERHEAGEARVIPTILRPCDWQSAPFGKLQSLPKDVNPVTKWDNIDEAFLDIARGIRKAAAEVSSSRSSNISPTVEPPRPTPSVYIPDALRVDFVGRSDNEGNDHIARLKEELAPHKRRLVALWGAGGVGKTALAAEAARALSDDFAQRVVWVSADGREDFSLSSLLDEIARQLKYEDLRKLALESKKEQVREVVAAAPTLVVLDNFETISPEEARLCAEWLAQPVICSALITTRDRVEAAARNIVLRPMLSEEARTFLRRLVSEVHEPSAFEGLDYDRVIQTADANPLVLQWIVGQIDLAQSPQEVLDDLKHGEGSAAERVFDRSFNLKQMDNGGRAVLLALSLFVPGATRKALADVAGLGKDKDRKRFKDAVRTLSALWLIRATDASQRLAVEGLTRELAKARLSRDPRAATFHQRFVSRFRNYAELKSKINAENLNSLEDEKDNILSAMDVAKEIKEWKSFLSMAADIYNFLMLRGYWDEAVRTAEGGLTIARNSLNEEWIALFTHNLATTHQSRGELSKARRLYDESLEIHRRLGVQRGAAVTLNNLAALAFVQGDISIASQLYDESLEINRELGDQLTIALTLKNLATIAKDEGDISTAHRLNEESLEIKRRIDDQQGIARSLLLSGALAQEQDDMARARSLYEDSLNIYTKLGEQPGIAYSLHQLGLVDLDEGKFASAETLFNQSLAILRKLEDKLNLPECLESIGRLRVEQGAYAEAHEFYKEALQIAQDLGAKFRVASVQRSLGLLAAKETEKEKAKELLCEALTAFEELKSPKADATRQDLEKLEREDS